MTFIGKVLPIEGYTVQLKEQPSLDYAKSLTHLYQPLIGMEAVMLYQTLLHEVDLQQASTIQTHHTLMNYLNIPLDDIYQARLKLEGIGLLRTFRTTEDMNVIYIYELRSPFTPERFFQDGMLTELLYHHLGETKYEFLESHYLKDVSVEQEEDVTASFHEVFQTFEPSLDINHVDNVEVENQKLVTSIDFSWMEMMLKQRMIPTKKVLTVYNRKLISEMMFLYDLAAHEVEKSLLWALTEENILDIDEFKLACHDLFKTKHHQVPIQLVPKKLQQSKQENSKLPQTKEEKLIQRLETISPKHLLEDLSNGNQASEQDMRIIREVMTTQGLPAPVMNVLIHYVLLQSNMKLSKAYLEKIASHWSRANLTTAKEAMEFAKNEIKRSQESFSKNRYNNRKQVSNEIIPEWFENRNKQEPQEVKHVENSQSQKEKEEIDALLQQYAGE